MANLGGDVDGCTFLNIPRYAASKYRLDRTFQSVSQSVVLNSISRIMRHHMCDNVQSHSLSPNVCFLRVRGTGAYDLKDRMQGRFTGVTLMEHLRAGIIRHSRDVLMVARWIAHGLNIEA